MTTDAPSDPNAALWASLRPPPPPSWHQNLRERAAELSLPLLAERIGSSVPPWVTSRWAARHWLASAVLGLSLGLGLGLVLRPIVRPSSDAQQATAPLRAASAPARATVGPSTSTPLLTGSPGTGASPVTTQGTGTSPVTTPAADEATSQARLASADPAAPQLDEAPTVEPRAARAKPKSRAARAAALKRRAKATAQRGARGRKGSKSSKASSNPRTIAAYLSARSRANRVAKSQ